MLGNDWGFDRYFCHDPQQGADSVTVVYWYGIDDVLRRIHHVLPDCSGMEGAVLMTDYKAELIGRRSCLGGMVIEDREICKKA